MPGQVNMWDELKMPFPSSDIRWRVGFRDDAGHRGSALAYVEARTVMNRLDDVLGPDGWSSEIKPIQEDGRLTGAICRLTIFVEGGEVVREDFGAAPEGQEAIKGAASDALKRAAVQFGVGRYLYELPSTWVNLDSNGRLGEIPELPDWALPEEEREERERQAARPSLAPRRSSRETSHEGLPRASQPPRGNRRAASWRE